ncbi:MAG: hypothetical protein QM796_06690 [Chthoniobacteraceae bacterium]
MRNKLAIVLSCLCLLAAGCTRQAPPSAAATNQKTNGDRIWTALLVASNNRQHPTAPDEIAELADRMRHVFGYNSFKLLGESTKEMSDSASRWLIPGRDFSVRITSQKKDGDRYVLEIELYKRKRLLVDSSAELGRRARSSSAPRCQRMGSLS